MGAGFSGYFDGRLGALEGRLSRWMLIYTSGSLATLMGALVALRVFWP